MSFPNLLVLSGRTFLKGKDTMARAFRNLDWSIIAAYLSTRRQLKRSQMSILLMKLQKKRLGCLQKKRRSSLEDLLESQFYSVQLFGLSAAVVGLEQSKSRQMRILPLLGSSCYLQMLPYRIRVVRRLWQTKKTRC